jgi:hypothetical protein
MKREDLDDIKLNIRQIFEELGFPITDVSIQARLTNESFDKLREEMPQTKREYKYAITRDSKQGGLMLFRFHTDVSKT